MARAIQPPRLRQATGKDACKRCRYFEPSNDVFVPGQCRAYKIGVKPDSVCDSYNAKPA